MIYDSLLIDFGKYESIHINAFVDTIRDLRNMPPKCVAITEKNKYVFVPVDNLVVTKKPISSEISSMFLQKPDSNLTKKYRIEINEFNIGSRKGMLQTVYTCNSAISVYSLDSTMKPHFSGTLLYENTISIFPKKKHLELGYENVIDNWKEQFADDFQKINTCYGQDSVCQLPNFRKEINAAKKNMFVNMETCIGSGSFLIDGEIIFSRPESQKDFFRSAYSLRYRNEKKYEAFETSIYNKQKYHRLSDEFLLILKSGFFVGFNRWKGDEYKNHGLEDVFLLNCSACQNIVWNRFFKNGITLGAGIMEDVTFIYSENFVFKPYAVIQIGIKL